MSDTAAPTPIWESQPPLGALQLAGAGLQAIWRHIAPMTLLALVATVLATGLAVGAREAGVSLSDDDLSVGHWSYELLKALAAAVVSGLALRVLLPGPGAGRLRLDRGFAAYVGLVAAARFVAALLFGLLGGGQDPDGAGEVILFLLAGVVSVVLTFFVYARLLLWPIGRLMGEAVPPARSWALMRGATLGYLLAIVLTFVPTVIPYVIMSISLGLDMGVDTAALPTIVVDEAFTAVWTLIGVAIAAAVYRARVMGERV